MGKNKHTWVIKNFSPSQSEIIYSDEFVISGCKWRLMAYPRGEWYRNFMSLFLEVPHSKSLPCGWRRRTKLYMSVVNQRSSKLSVLQERSNRFDQKTPATGFKTMISRSKLLSKTDGFLVGGEIKIVVRIDVLKVIGGVDVSESSSDESENESEEESEEESKEESENESEDKSEVASRPRKKTKLNDDDEVSDDFDNQSQQVKEFMSVHGFQVFPSQVNVVSRIFSKYPDIASDLQAKSPHMRTAFMNILLSVVETLCQAPLKLSDKDLLEADNAFAYMKDAGFKVDWLEKKLEIVKEKKREEETSATRMKELEKELKDAKQKYSNMEALLVKEKAKLVAVRAHPTSIKDKPSMDLGSKSKDGVKRSVEGKTKRTPNLMEERYEDKDDEHGDTHCGSCGGNYTPNDEEFWICCDVCERWYHGKCVKITPAKAESIEQYKCSSCCNKKVRP